MKLLLAFVFSHNVFLKMLSHIFNMYIVHKKYNRIQNGSSIYTIANHLHFLSISFPYQSITCMFDVPTGF